MIIMSGERDSSANLVNNAPKFLVQKQQLRSAFLWCPLCSEPIFGKGMRRSTFQ